jgi:hypothetical protein
MDGRQKTALSVNMIYSTGKKISTWGHGDLLVARDLKSKHTYIFHPTLGSWAMTEDALTSS